MRIKHAWLHWLALTSMLFSMLASAHSASAQNSPPPVQGSPQPMLAYYYIWFNVGSWDRAKTDYPTLGRYSSDDAAVMRQHIRWAKAAGLTGFIVSWKSTDVLNRRLDQLARVAEEEDFKLAVIYQGLDFDRNPQPVDRIAQDLDYFIHNFADRPVFKIFDRPLVIWSGTWEYSPQQVEQVTAQRRSALLLLASERNTKGYLRLADLVDGNAYYWSSVNPETFPNYQEKLNEMSSAIHEHGGLWIAPASAGFDARLIGGTSVVDRKNGDTFLTTLGAAVASSPDAIGVISWNEFSENSHIEPSQQHGSLMLDVLSGYNHLPLPNIPNFDSSEPDQTFAGIPLGRMLALGGLGGVLLASVVVVGLRQRFERSGVSPKQPPTESEV
jgi:hypothetical protein